MSSLFYLLIGNIDLNRDTENTHNMEYGHFRQYEIREWKKCYSFRK